MFSQACVILFTGGGAVRGCWGGACMVAGREACMVAGGCVWLPGGMHGCWGHAWLLGGMHGERGACMANGGVWQRGACVAKGVCVGYDEIQRYDQLAGGTHPTGIHSCKRCMFVCRYVPEFGSRSASGSCFCINNMQNHEQSWWL